MRATAECLRAGSKYIQCAVRTGPPRQPTSWRTISEASDMRGVVEEPSSWEEIKRKVQIGTVESLGSLGRLPTHIEIYRAFRKQKMEEWDGMGSYLNNKIWGWAPTIGANGRKTVAVPDDATKEPIWLENDFPYACQAGIEHHNIWCTIPLSTEQVDAVVEEHKPASKYETLTFVNPVELQSVRAIWHAHVFSRPLQGSTNAAWQR